MPLSAYNSKIAEPFYSGVDLSNVPPENVSNLLSNIPDDGVHVDESSETAPSPSIMKTLLEHKLTKLFGVSAAVAGAVVAVYMSGRTKRKKNGTAPKTTRATRRSARLAKKKSS